MNERIMRVVVAPFYLNRRMLRQANFVCARYLFGFVLNEQYVADLISSTDQEYDHRLTTHHFYAREYDARNANWLTKDPYRGTLRAPKTLARYAYVHGNPITATDLFGFACNYGHDGSVVCDSENELSAFQTPPSYPPRISDRADGMYNTGTFSGIEIRSIPYSANASPDLSSYALPSHSRVDLQALPCGPDWDSTGSAKQYWLSRARAAAGIKTWDISKGYLGNIETVQNVYKYYGNAYVKNPEMKWVGMAGAAGHRTFYPAFAGINMAKNLTDLLSKQLLGLPNPALQAQGLWVRLVHNEVAILESEFLDIQQKIYDDMAPQIEAYGQCGMGCIQALYDERAIDANQYKAWGIIDNRSWSGADQLNASQQFVWREQRETIQDNYDNISQRPLGALLTGALSTSALAPFPETGGLRFNEERGNLGNSSDRIGWTNNNMLPSWHRITDTPGAAEAILGSDLGVDRRLGVAGQVEHIYADHPQVGSVLNAVGASPAFVANTVNKLIDENELKRDFP